MANRQRLLGFSISRICGRQFSEESERSRYALHRRRDVPAAVLQVADFLMNNGEQSFCSRILWVRGRQTFGDRLGLAIASHCPCAITEVGVVWITLNVAHLQIAGDKFSLQRRIIPGFTRQAVEVLQRSLD